MSRRHVHISLLVAFVIFLLIPNSVLADGFTLAEVAPAGTLFTKVTVMWTNEKHEVVATSIQEGFSFSSVTFKTDEVALQPGKGTIRDWKETRTLNDGSQPSTLEGVFAKGDSPLRILSYNEAYSILGLTFGDFLFLPNFNADLDNDGFAETQLFSAINMFDLALNFPQFVNNQPFNFGQSYLASEFMAFGFVFSLSDNVGFDVDTGYITSTPLSPSISIIPGSMHVTGAVPEPSTWLLLGSGMAALVIWRRYASA
jgi:hypothetical protein